jgi:carbon storage regulator CsrA
MVVLNRKAGERVLVGSNIEVVVVEVCGDQVKLGFECPRDIRVLRDELQWHSIPQQTKGTNSAEERILPSTRLPS